MIVKPQAFGKLTGLHLVREENASSGEARLKILSDRVPSLSALLPPFSDFGLEVTDERTQAAESKDGVLHEIDLGLRTDAATWWDDHAGETSAFRERFIDAVRAVWEGHCESDPLNSLVVTADLSWRQVTWLRAVAAYMRQTHTAFSLPYICESVAAQPTLGALAVRLFEERLNPGRHNNAAQRTRAIAAVASQYADRLDTVTNLDEDRILRAMLGVVQAIDRTNAYQRDIHGTPPRTLSIKFAPHRVPTIPHPRPKAEIWVYGPQVEGIHMRFGKVARGGIRWSDRREDIRMEVLALTKAQVSKNAVIVPTGAKGAFLPKHLPDPADREAWLKEGHNAYREFIAALLDVTDNRINDSVIAPDRVVRHDEDDPYLVVAADKGTATFSDSANEIARRRDFWLGDAFASGGSAGYDHKAMGITARGAWVSVERHLREAGLNPLSRAYTVVGIGDMSGDVFGNGMLLATNARLVAAFDHRHIFLDPDPDPTRAHAERKRLATLPRSSWADYDPACISNGGMVVDRSAKSVRISRKIIDTLDLDPATEQLTPAELIKSILMCPVDLLWNGGIGTYVKASTESHDQVGDGSNDDVRVDANQLRVKVIGEGGNLGLTQAARVEAALNGVRLNTDAVDNSAGVATSDYEVNIKIALALGKKELEASGVDRIDVLRSMTDDVAETVLENNHDQNVLLASETRLSAENLPALRLLIRSLAESGHVEPTRDGLPDESALSAREAAGQGLVCPELAVLMGSTKNSIKDALRGSSLFNDPWFIHTLRQYFPERLQSLVPSFIDAHPLGSEIIVNEVVNDVVNRAGITAIHRAVDDTGASIEQVVRAYVTAIEVFDHRRFSHALDMSKSELSYEVGAAIRYEGRRLLDRAARWFANRYPSGFVIGDVVSATKDRVSLLSEAEPERLWGQEKNRLDAKMAEFEARGASAELARIGAAYLDSYVLLDIVEIADGLRVPAEDVADLYHYVSDQFRIDYLLTRVSLLPRRTHWDRLARTALREELYAVQSKLTRTVAASAPRSSPQATPREVFEAWQATITAPAVRARKTIANVCIDERPQLNSLTVAVRGLQAMAQGW